MPYITHILTDYHMHSTFSPDGHNTPQELCRQALALGLKEIAITEHAEWHPKMAKKGLPDVEGYFAAIERCRAEFGPLGLTVYSGIELGNPHRYPAEVGAFLKEYPFEVRLGSLHWLYEENIHEACCFAGHDPDEVYTDYFVELGHLAQSSEIDIIAHFDRILWRGTLLGLPFNLVALEPVIRRTMGIIAQSGRALELNTTFVAHKPGWLPALETMFAWFYEEGGRRVIVNSDAHRTTDIGRHRATAAELLTRAGFELPAHLFRVGLVYEYHP